MTAAHIPDLAARRSALDPSQSFIVQAPAGSGKTELLIQRYLLLLAYVDHPEEIVAATFTRKAAGEMRERVLQALADAQAGKIPATGHEQLTLELATAALARDTKAGCASRKIRRGCASRPSTRCARRSRARCQCCRNSARSRKASRMHPGFISKRRAQPSNWSRAMTRSRRISSGCSRTSTTMSGV